MNRTTWDDARAYVAAFETSGSWDTAEAVAPPLLPPIQASPASPRSPISSSPRPCYRRQEGASLGATCASGAMVRLRVDVSRSTSDVWEILRDGQAAGVALLALAVLRP
jgi:hypothetical protein